MDAEEWVARLPILRTEEFLPEALILGEGPATYIHVVLHGIVRHSLVAADGRERVVSYLQRGNLFGEQRALAAEPSSSTSFTFADTACVVGYIDPEEFVAQLQREPDLLRELLRLTHQKKRRLLEELDRAVFGSARSQIAALLLLLAREPGDARVIPVSQERLAQLSGRTRVTVATQLHALAAAGAIRLDRSRIVVCDAAILAELAELADEPQPLMSVR